MFFTPPDFLASAKFNGPTGRLQSLRKSKNSHLDFLGLKWSKFDGLNEFPHARTPKITSAVQSMILFLRDKHLQDFQALGSSASDLKFEVSRLEI